MIIIDHMILFKDNMSFQTLSWFIFMYCVCIYVYLLAISAFFFSLYVCVCLGLVLRHGHTI